MKGRRVEDSASNLSTAQEPLVIMAATGCERFRDVMGKEPKGYESVAVMELITLSLPKMHSNSVARPVLSPHTNQSRFR